MPSDDPNQFAEIREILRDQADKIAKQAENLALLTAAIQTKKADEETEEKSKKKNRVTVQVIADRIDKLVYINIAALGATGAREFIGTSPFVVFAFVISTFILLFTAMMVFDRLHKRRKA